MCFRYFGFTSFAQVDCLTPAQYDIMLEAYRYKMVDEAYIAHRQAFLNFAVQAEKKSGKKTRPVYKYFDDFFDYDGEIERVKTGKKKKSRFAGIGKLLRREGNG